MYVASVLWDTFSCIFLCIIICYCKINLPEYYLFISAFTALHIVPIRPISAEIWTLVECSVIPVHYCIELICAVSGNAGDWMYV